MTKKQEIDRFRKFVESIPESGTYTGAWLRSQLPAIEKALSDDNLPEFQVLSAEGFLEYRDGVIKSAEAKAERTVARAEAYSDKLVEEAQNRAAAVLATARRKVEGALRDLQ